MHLETTWDFVNYDVEVVFFVSLIPICLEEHQKRLEKGRNTKETVKRDTEESQTKKLKLYLIGKVWRG